ncbi:DUF4142 domain-containing protein [Luteolibacter sp. GHJ8]|uniref:DUF4142 domain-containing protein n=1 Tax=Luteolibacter rhizosphaerae TaxID=2989719 RepID=A0ABT3FZD5_9BACT|nr:DUF4142 domain-containing protein [Luteolibacter rhizosphaerae]MCW1912958.1 DUF4142 domain-containing protein [Luteolibacter rhizosphaerae]
MNRRILLRSAGFTAMGLSLTLTAKAKDDGKAGELGAAEFKKINSEAGSKLKALKVNDTALSEADKALVDEVALGGMMQLQVSEIALEKTTSADVKLIAGAEVEEQTGLAAKLKEFASAKGTKLPTQLNDKGRKLLADLKAAGKELDRVYLEKSGVEGHQELMKTMSKVKASAVDNALKALAETALPLIEVHLAVAKQEVLALG